MQTQSSNDMPHRYISPLDVHLMKLNPNHQPKSEESMIRSILGRQDPSRLDELWKIHVERANAIVAHLQEQPVKAAKPKPGDPVVFYDIPDSGHLAIRRWNGGLDKDRAYCFDLYDTSRDTAINLPAGFKISKLLSNSNDLATISISGQTQRLHSLEEIWGRGSEDIRAGCERFVVREGSRLALIQPNKSTFFFAFPQRPAA